MAKGLPKSLKRAGEKNTLPAATATKRGAVLKGAAVTNATVEADATSVATQFNALLASLRNAGVITT